MYKHTQKSDMMTATSMVLLGVAIVAGYIAKQPIVVYPLGLAALGAYFSFRELTVEVDDASVRISFGAGWIKKEIKLGDISSAEAVRNSWMYGLGVQYIGNGWLYNVSGLDAVELKLKSGKRARIGTDEPQVLETEIKSRLAAK